MNSTVLHVPYLLRYLMIATIISLALILFLIMKTSGVTPNLNLIFSKYLILLLQKYIICYLALVIFSTNELEFF